MPVLGGPVAFSPSRIVTEILLPKPRLIKPSGRNVVFATPDDNRPLPRDDGLDRHSPPLFPISWDYTDPSRSGVP